MLRTGDAHAMTGPQVLYMIEKEKKNAVPMVSTVPIMDSGAADAMCTEK